MITTDQQTWLDHLSNTETIEIIPWDETAEEKFLIVKNQITDLIGSNTPVLHRGATALHISGQDEIDIYVPVSIEIFDQTATQLATLYHDPQSHYPMKRVRFRTMLQNKKIDIFVINEKDKDWQNSELFHHILLTNPEKLNAYRTLKEKLAGTSAKHYYTKKTEFINEITGVC